MRPGDTASIPRARHLGSADSPATLNAVIRSGLLLVLLGLPGMILWLASLVALVVGLMPPSEVLWAVGGAAGFLVSLPMMLAGAGVWGKWRYLWVFTSLPATLFATFVSMLVVFNPGKDTFLLVLGFAGLVALAVTLVVAARVKASYSISRITCA